MKKILLIAGICVSLQASSDRIYKAGLFSTIVGNIATFIALKSKNAPVPFPSLLRFGKSRAALAVTYAANYPLWFVSATCEHNAKNKTNDFLYGITTASSQICAAPFIIPLATYYKASYSAHNIVRKS